MRAYPQELITDAPREEPRCGLLPPVPDKSAAAGVELAVLVGCVKQYICVYQEHGEAARQSSSIAL